MSLKLNQIRFYYYLQLIIKYTLFCLMYDIYIFYLDSSKCINTISALTDQEHFHVLYVWMTLRVSHKKSAIKTITYLRSNNLIILRERTFIGKKSFNNNCSGSKVLSLELMWQLNISEYSILTQGYTYQFTTL